MSHNFYSVKDATMLTMRRHMKEVVELSGAAREFVLRGRSDPGRGIQELHLDFDTEEYSFWVTFKRSGAVIFYRHARNIYDRRKFFFNDMPPWHNIRSILAAV